MQVRLPEEFVSEIGKCKPEELAELREDCRLLLDRKTPAPKIKDKMVEAGWSEAFSTWYSVQVRDMGTEFEMVIRSPSPLLNSQSTYERAIEVKKDQALRGWMFVAVACVLQISTIPIALGTLQANPSGNPASGGLLLAMLVGSWILWFLGLANLLDSKARPRAFAWLGLFGLFGLLVICALRDYNIIRNPEGDGSRSEGSTLSNW